MKALIFCDTALDKICEINLLNSKIEETPFNLENNAVGPCGIDYHKNNLFIANSYDNSITIFDIKEKAFKSHIYIGGCPRGVKVFEDKIYIVCSDANSLGIIDINKENFITIVPVGNYPCHIEINKDKNVAYIVNMYKNSLSIVDCFYYKIISEITGLSYPIKAILSKNKKILFICESSMGLDKCGYITFLSVKNNKIICKIEVGTIPTDMYEDNGLLYVSNMGNGLISIISIKNKKVIGKIYYSGHPKEVVKYENYLYIADWKDGNIYSINLDKKEDNINKIASGKEPNAMLFI